MKCITGRLDDLERRMDQLEPRLVPDLVDILRCFPGGFASLATASGYHRETIYQFSSASRTKKFPHKRAAAIARAFGSRKACGQRVTIELLRQAWMAKKNQPPEGVTV